MNRAELRAAIRQSCDMENSQFVSDAELNTRIEVSTRELYDLLVARYGDEYFAQIAWIDVNNSAPNRTDVAWPNMTIAFAQQGPDANGRDIEDFTGYAVPFQPPTPMGGVTSSYALPRDFWRLLRVEFTPGVVALQRVEIYRTPESDTAPLEREAAYGHQYRLAPPSGPTVPMRRMQTPGMRTQWQPSLWNQGAVQYRLRGGSIRMVVGGDALFGDDPSRDEPRPLSGLNPSSVIQFNGTLIDFLPPPLGRYAVAVTYVPKARQLVEDGMQFAYDHPEYVIADVAAWCLEKQEDDSRALRAEQARIVQSIETLDRTKDAGDPPEATDYYGGIFRRRNCVTDDGAPW